MELSLSVIRNVDRDYLLRTHWGVLAKVDGRKAQILKPKKRYGLGKLSKSETLLLPNNIVTIANLVHDLGMKHQGKFFLCRTIVPTVKGLLGGLITVVDDPRGLMAVRLSIYNFKRDSLPTGTILAVKDPWLKGAMDGGITVRCDKPSDVVVLNQIWLNNLNLNVEWKAEIPKMPVGKGFSIPNAILASIGTILFMWYFFDVL